MRHLVLPTVLSFLALTACAGNDVKDTLGLTRHAPDEYRVVSRPPLSVPPQFNLRPPATPGDHTNPNAADDQAKSLILGTPSGNTFALPSASDTQAAPVQAKTSAKPTPETSLLEKAGATNADPNVRTVIEKEKAAAVQVQEEKDWWDLSILPEKKEPTVAAKKEAERLKKNEEEGKPVTEGETPDSSSGRDTGILGNILGY